MTVGEIKKLLKEVPNTYEICLGVTLKIGAKHSIKYINIKNNIEISNFLKKCYFNTEEENETIGYIGRN